ncbi:MAG: hypothetical protein Q7R47_02780 [Candidatus Diapherotrites archaeon]|nr:hypothetical protein [Candidatus Diapherotrites archaeon]
MVLNKRGIDMAIQVFVVLFVLLAIAMLVLRLVSEQTSQQIKVLNEEAKKAELSKIKSQCDQVCVNSCDSPQSQVGYCLRLIESSLYDKGAMDFSGDGFTTSFVDEEAGQFSGGLYGLCEDRVYCSQLSPCKCGNKMLDMRNCFNVVCDYWSRQGANIEELMTKFFPAPVCDMSDDQLQRHWIVVYQTLMTCNSG